MAFPLIARLWPILSGFKETTSSGPNGSGRLRVLEIRLQFSELKIKRKPTNIYMNLWIDPRRKLRTRIVDTGTESKLDWEEKFIFSVSENFLVGANATISFEIYQARNIPLRDSLVGCGVCHLNSLFDNQINDDEIDKDVVYDEEGEEDPRYGNMYDESSEDSWRKDEAEEEAMKA